jgi:hypothetical protein
MHMQVDKPKRVGGLYGRNSSPWLPAQVMRLVCLHDFAEKNFREIGDELGLTRAAIAKQYARWYKWARKQPEYGPACLKKRRRV